MDFTESRPAIINSNIYRYSSTTFRVGWYYHTVKKWPWGPKSLRYRTLNLNDGRTMQDGLGVQSPALSSEELQDTALEGLIVISAQICEWWALNSQDCSADPA